MALEHTRKREQPACSGVQSRGFCCKTTKLEGKEEDRPNKAMGSEEYCILWLAVTDNQDRRGVMSGHIVTDWRGGLNEKDMISNPISLVSVLL